MTFSFPIIRRLSTRRVATARSARLFSRLRRISVLLLSVMLSAAIAEASSVLPLTGAAAAPASHWVSAWTKPIATSIASYELSKGMASIAHYSCRFDTRVTASGSALRVRLSNLFVPTTTTLTKVVVAEKSGLGTVIPGTSHRLSVAGNRTITMAPGIEVTTDPLSVPVNRGTEYYVSFYVAGATALYSDHPTGIASSFCGPAGSGDHTEDATSAAMPLVSTNVRWVTGVEVLADSSARTIVAFGDSITDGQGSTQNANLRWPDLLADRLSTTKFSVVNGGIASNTLTPTVMTAPGSPAGQAGVVRFDRDVLQQAGVAGVIIFEGTNDALMQVSAARQIAAMQGLAAKAHAAGLRVIGATMLPKGGSWSETPTFPAIRAEVNSWIRTTHSLDAYIDFDAVMKNTDPSYRPDGIPATPLNSNFDEFIAQRYDSGDHVHPNDAGYRAMADAIDLSIF